MLCSSSPFAGSTRSPRGKWAAVAMVAAAACMGAVLFVSQVSAPTVVLESCTPCTSGPGCVAGCVSGGAELRQGRMQQLAEAQHPVKQVVQMDAGVHTSLHDQESAIQRKNEQLLQMGHGKEALGGVLDAAVKQVLRAEAAEVKLRRQAALSKGASVASVYKNLRSVGVRVHPSRACVRGAACYSVAAAFESEAREEDADGCIGDGCICSSLE